MANRTKHHPRMRRFEIPPQIRGKLIRDMDLSENEQRIIRRWLDANTPTVFRILCAVIDSRRPQDTDTNRSRIADYIDRDADGYGRARLLPYDIRVLNRLVESGLVFQKRRAIASGRGGELRYSVPRSVRELVDQISYEQEERANEILERKDRANSA